MMNSRRIRERIEKVERINGTSRNKEYLQTPMDYNNYLSTPNFNSSAGFVTTNSMSELHKAVLQIATRLETTTKSSQVLGGYKKQMQLRDHYVLIQAPKLDSDQQNRDKQIKLWLGDVLHHVFSVSFNHFSNKKFDTQTMKIFCSECCIANLLSLSKKNPLTPQDYKLINLHLKTSLLPYFLLRYPQSSNRQVNQKLNKQVSTTDYLNTNENNMFLKSKIKFEYRDNGIYFDLIMKFLNYIQEIPNKQLAQEGFQTFYDDFNQRMEGLFTAVYNRKWTETNLYDQYIKYNMPIQILAKKVKQLEAQVGHSSTNIKQKQKKKSSKAEADKDYEDSVKQYTIYMINRKVSQNVPVYSSQQIEHGKIKILNPAILRIIVKWCTQLEEKFQTDYFTERNQPFVMINGDEAEMVDEEREKLSQYAAAQWKDIQKFLQSIQSNIYQKQAELSFENLMYYSTQKLPQYQQGVIKFANRNTEDVNHYAVIYLNRLIHGLMKMSKKIYEGNLDGWAEWPYPPTFLTFTISDLMRCRVFSKEKQIIRIYKQLQLQSQLRPDIMKLVKVKNRLNKGTKDILLNVLFHKQVLCEIQLAIKLDVSDFSLYSDKFNHYVYELQRSTYGPVTEMCSIWSSNDERTSFLDGEKIRIQEIQHKCQGDSLEVQIFPFTCSRCYKHYSELRYIYDHFKCKQCINYWICGLCRINTSGEAELIQQLRQKQNTIEITGRILQNTQFPEYFVGFLLESMKMVGQKFRKVNIDKETMIVKIDNGKLTVIKMKKNDKKFKKRLIDNYIFFEQKNPDPQLVKITPQQILDETTLSQIQQCYSKKSQALRITRRNITQQLLTRIKDFRAQFNINSLSFPQNNISSIKQICDCFPNIKILNLNRNKISSIQGIGRLLNLTDLYLGENSFKEIVQLDNLVNLKYLQLGDNASQPEFKCCLSKLVNLQSLTLVRSNLQSFPAEVCNLKNLKLLWLFQNQIEQLPSSIGNLLHLQYLHLQMNLLECLPQQIYSLTKMKKLLLSYNKIQQISQKIEQLTNLQMLTLLNNPLKKVPKQKLQKLKRLQVITMNKGLEETIMGKLFASVIYK